MMTLKRVETFVFMQSITALINSIIWSRSNNYVTLSFARFLRIFYYLES